MFTGYVNELGELKSNSPPPKNKNKYSPNLRSTSLPVLFSPSYISFSSCSEKTPTAKVVAIIACVSLLRVMNGTIVLFHNGVDRHLDSVLWLHVIISLLVSGVCLPLLYILKRRQHAFLISLEIISAAAIGIGILFGIMATNKYHSTSHSILGYLILLMSEIYLVLDLWRQRQRCRAKLAPTPVRISHFLFFPLIERLVPFIVYIEIVLGAIAA